MLVPTLFQMLVFALRIPKFNMLQLLNSSVNISTPYLTTPMHSSLHTNKHHRFLLVCSDRQTTDSCRQLLSLIFVSFLNQFASKSY